MTTKHNTLTAALAAFQAELPKVGKGALNPHFKSKYADLADVVAVVLPALAKQGLAWVTTPTLTDHGFVLAYELRHESGETIHGEWPLPDPGTPAQQLGSAVTYAKRYTLSAVTGIAPDEDDDGNAANTANRRPSRGAEPSGKNPGQWLADVSAASTDIHLQAVYREAQKAFGGAVPDPPIEALAARKKALVPKPAQPAEDTYEALVDAEYTAAVERGEVSGA